MSTSKMFRTSLLLDHIMFFRCCPSVYIYLYVYINSPLPKHSPPSRPFICFRTAAFGHPAHDNSFVHLPRDQVDKATGDARWTRVNDGGWWWYWLLMMTNDGKWMLLIYWWLMMVDDDSWCLMFGTLVLISMTLCQNTQRAMDLTVFWRGQIDDAAH